MNELKDAAQQLKLIYWEVNLWKCNKKLQKFIKCCINLINLNSRDNPVWTQSVPTC